MLNAFYIAWQYIRFNRIKTGVLVICITLIIFLPFSLQLLLSASERQLMSRAVSTPLIIGAKGSALDLIMNTLYFGNEQPELITMGELNRIWESDLATAIPLYTRFKARGVPIVGTTLDYFNFRELRIETGRQMAVLGECVIGARAAEKLNLKPGDHLVSSPENLFDIAGIYPLKMRIVGVLEKAHSPDDLSVFVDLKTAWIIQGLGHGHKDVTKLQDPTLVLKRSQSNVAATAKLFHFSEITKTNIDTFHFHGDIDVYPITAVIAVPFDEKSNTLLQGRYLDKDGTRQIQKPREVIGGLLQNIFRIKNVLDAVVSIVSIATILSIILVFMLSLRLRQAEIQTIFKIGCSRMTIVKLLGAEILIILCSSAVLCGILMFILNRFTNDLVRMLFIS